MMMLVLVLGTVVTFSSCSDDDNDGDSSSSIVGTWYRSSNAGASYNEFTFENGGTGIRYEKGVDHGREYEDTYYFAWKIDGEELYIQWFDNREDIKAIDINDKTTWGEKCRYSISGNQLTFIYGDGSKTYTHK